MVMKKVISDIKDKKELSSLDDDFVGRVVERGLDEKTREKIKSANNFSELKRSSVYKDFRSKARKVLREVYGVFILKGFDRKEAFLKELEENGLDLDVVDNILELHQSTKERLPFYEEVYEKIFSITGEPKKVLDVGCGLNPVSYPYLGCEPGYVCSDLCSPDVSFLQRFFDVLGIDGKAFQFDLLQFRDNKFLKHFSYDVCFMFKLLDSLESLERGFSKKLIGRVPADFVVVSFPTKSIGGGKSIKERGWIERDLRELGLGFESFEIPNEIFYVVKK